MRIVLVMAVLAIGCSSKKSPCERAVHKVLEVTTAAPKGSEPHADEQEVIDQIETMTVSACEKEGLDQAQLDCILALQSMRDLQDISKCPAIAAKRPTWVLAP